MSPGNAESTDRRSYITVEIVGESRSFANGLAVNVDQSHVWSAMARMVADGSDDDCSFSQFVGAYSFEQDVVAAATGYVEGFNAAHADKISVRSLIKAEKAADSIEGDRQFRLNVPYRLVPETLYAQGTSEHSKLMLNSQIVKINWEKDRVNCFLANGQNISGDAAVITLPLPLLQQNLIEFKPPLNEKKSALEQMEMGQVQRIVFLFKERFWENITIDGQRLNNASFLLFDAAPFRTWWTLAPIKAPVLVAWNAGRAYLEGNIKPGQLVDVALSRLAEFLSLDKTVLDDQLITYKFHDWANDPFAMGAYSYCRSGGSEAPRLISQPLKGTLYFAGEATNYDGHFGTVHGAIATGYRAANQYLADHKI